MLASIGAAGITRGVLDVHGQQFATYVLTPTRLDALAAGGVLAWMTRRRIGSERRWSLLLAVGLSLVAFVPAAAVGNVAWEWAQIAFCAALVITAAYDRAPRCAF
jgi:peptidoglycan/LPS O-acetylase OafA/YrhL